MNFGMIIISNNKITGIIQIIYKKIIFYFRYFSKNRLDTQIKKIKCEQYIKH